MSADSVIPFAFESLPIHGSLSSSVAYLATEQIQGSGALQMLVMQCTSDLDLRGTATPTEKESARDLVELTAGAHCATTVDNGERPYQGYSPTTSYRGQSRFSSRCGAKFFNVLFD